MSYGIVVRSAIVYTYIYHLAKPNMAMRPWASPTQNSALRSTDLADSSAPYQIM